jgi:tetratricopeptide (TPR) repeat protein
LNLIKTCTYLSRLGLTILVLTIFFSSCSTKKNTFTRRVYHNLTAHFNVYWNGMDNMRSGVKEFEASVKDNYSLVLPVYNFGDKASINKIGQYCDIGIKKATKTIQKHSMYFNRREYNRWIDDAYMLIGKAYFYKQDYPMARRTFEFVIKGFNDKDIKYDAMLWQALANCQLGDFGRAEPMLDMVQNMIKQGKAPEKYEERLILIYAQFFILQKNYLPATEYLNRALELNPKRTLKTRIMFILAQIHQKNGELDLAANLYKQIIKRNASFDMEFNSKINLAQCYIAKSGNREFITKKLNKMLKDEKNKDYLDQIYYALANISLKDSDTAQAIVFLKKSVSSSSVNNYQKAMSALNLADILFIHKDYRLAQSYYDSTMQFLPKDYPNYKEINKKTATLTGLVKNLQIISREDSLQKIATLSKDERDKIIDKIIADLLADELKRQKEDEERQQNLLLFGQEKYGQDPGGIGGPGSPTSAGASVGSWYFYNPSAMSTGFSTFTKKWGHRKSEDNWFLTNKAIQVESMESTEDTSMLASDTTKGSKVLAKSKNPKERDYYMQDIPFKPEQVKASTDRIIQAYYNLGFIYVEELKDYVRSIEAFETLDQRFPGNKYTVPILYELYMLYKDVENQPKSDEFKNLILTKYPESDFAKLIINPEYYKIAQSKQQEITLLYEDTYKSFINHQYYMVINNAGVALAKYPGDTAMIPKFEYLKGLSIGKIEVEDSLVSAMQKIVTKYPRSRVRPLAENVLAFLGKQKNSTGGTSGQDTTKKVIEEVKIYSYNPKAIHFYVLIVDNNLVNVGALKIKISDFNSKFHDLDNLQVNSILLEGAKEMITVSNFDDAEKSMNYFISIHESQYIFGKLENAGTFTDFAISADNYPIFYRSKNEKQYLTFFEKNYPVKK